MIFEMTEHTVMEETGKEGCAVCGRFYIDNKIWRGLPETVECRIPDRIAEMRMDIVPSQQPPVLRLQSERMLLEPMRWGLPGTDKKLLINARAETVLERPMFRESFLYRRLIIPAAGFYEWSAAKEKAEFTRPDADAMFLAGFYNLYGGENRFIILTVPANISVSPVHDRMPLILEPGVLEKWLYSTPEAERMLGNTMPPLARRQEYEQQSFFSLLQ